MRSGQFDGKLFMYSDSQELFHAGIFLSSCDECVLLRKTIIPAVGLDSNVIVNRSAHDIATTERSLTKRTRCSNVPMAPTINLSDAAKPPVAMTTTSETVAMPTNTLQVKLSSGKEKIVFVKLKMDFLIILCLSKFES